jgi:hypothetical protein
MLIRSQVDELEKLIGQLESLHSELSALAKKSPNDAVNTFKLRFVNATLKGCNLLLGEKYKPFSDFEQLDTDDVPSNSDVTLIISQYLQAAEKFRSDNIYQDDFGHWYYTGQGSGEEIETAPPAKLKK